MITLMRGRSFLSQGNPLSFSGLESFKSEFNHNESPMNPESS